MVGLISPSMAKRLAGLELNVLLYSKALPSYPLKRASIEFSGTPIYDINGEILFYRIPIIKRNTPIAFADIAAHPAFSSPLISVTTGLKWSEKEFVKRALAEIKKKEGRFEYDTIRFVTYSYPKIAIQLLKNGKETLMIELETWTPIPIKINNSAKDFPSNLERWSLSETISDSQKHINLKKLEERIKKWADLYPQPRTDEELDVLVYMLDPTQYNIFTKYPVWKTDKRELHYSWRDYDHKPCYELRGQETSSWCVAASVQMILDFYRYNYLQTRIAKELNLGEKNSTIDPPHGLSPSRISDVVTVLEKLTKNALDVNMNQTPAWTQFVTEIKENRPLISLVSGHSRTVAGYSLTTWYHWFTFRGLLIYDPWPPTSTTDGGGVITRWENFDVQTYLVTYTSQLKLV